MKIAFVSFYNGIIERGAETWTLQLAARLKSLGHDITLIQSGPAKSSEITTIIIPGKSVFGFSLKILPVLSRINYDVVIPINGGWLSLFTRLVTWFKSEKMVIVGHSGRGRDDMINAWCFPNRFVALSSFAQAWVHQTNPFIQVVHIPVGVDVDKFTPLGKKAKLPLQAPLVLAVAALVKSKQLNLTIRAVAKLTKVNLLILGKGEEEKTLKELAETLMPDRCLITHASFAQMPEYYRAANIFTLCSWTRESYPAVYLEAMACGLPIVATADPTRQEIAGQAGLLVDPLDISTYAATLEQTLMTNWDHLPRRQAEKFDWHKIALEYEKMFLSL